MSVIVTARTTAREFIKSAKTLGADDPPVESDAFPVPTGSTLGGCMVSLNRATG
jgi:hypothetical protein